MGFDGHGGQVTIRSRWSGHDIVGSDGDGGEVTILWVVIVTVVRLRFVTIV